MATWAEAFRLQAASDLAAYELPVRSALPECQRLHYLQMWLEKLCKAYIWAGEINADELKKKHNVVDHALPMLILNNWRFLGFQKAPELGPLRKLCREIDLLHPQIDGDGRRPENAEYPWAGASGTIEIPARWKFSITGRLHPNPGRALLKAAKSLTNNPPVNLGQ